MIERIAKFLGIDNGRTNEKLTPVGKPLLNKDLNVVSRKYDWEYHGAIGMLTYLTGSVRPDIVMAVHQCACFSINPKRSHEQAVMRIGRYLLSTKEKGMIYRPDCLKGIEVYIGADFAGGWDPADPMNAESIYSRTGYVICYAGCPVYWQSKLQTEIALCTAEAEDMALLQALGETLLTSNLMKEINVIFHSTFLHPGSLSKYKRTINLSLLWLAIPSFLRVHDILQSNIIIFANMLLHGQIQMVLFKLSIVLQMIKLQTFLQNLFVMISF